MISTFFAWFWLIANLAIVWLALTRKLNYLVRSLIVGGAILGAAAGLCNGLVMTLNGWRMPVESHVGYSGAPAFFSGPAASESICCRIYLWYDPPSDPWHDRDLHVYVTPPKPLLPAPDYEEVPGTVLEDTIHPKLAFLDDRHPFVVCGETTFFSKGDILGVLGAIIIIPGLLLALMGFIWRKLRSRIDPHH